MTDLREEPGMARRELLRRRPRRWPWGAAATLIAGLVLALFWFQPQKLFVDDRVNEAVPVATLPPATAPEADATATATAPTTAPASVAPAEIARGTFVSLDHGTTGVTRVLELADGRRVVRLEGLDTSNGPDLFLYLTNTPAAGAEATFDDDYVNLGRLKGNQGEQNYDVPAGTDLARFATVLIWCDRFNSAFGAADLWF